MSGDQHDDDPDDGEPKTQRDATERSSKNVPDPGHADDRSDEAAEEGDGEGGDGGGDRGARRKRRPLDLVVALLVLAPLVLGAVYYWLSARRSSVPMTPTPTASPRTSRRRSQAAWSPSTSPTTSS